MTKEDAKEYIVGLLEVGGSDGFDYNQKEALTMAIKALEQTDTTGDTISRQAAIDAICKACSMGEDYHKCDGYPETSTWCDELVALRALPSTQPEIIRCKGCKQFRRWIDTDICFCDITESERSDNDFCSYAERRTDEND